MKNIIIIILLIYSVTMSQTGSIMGTVQDASTKEKLIGVNITIPGTTIGAATDIDGNFTIPNIPVGSYQLKASTIGYDALVKSDVIVASGRPAMIDFKLTEKIVEVGGVTVTSELFGVDPTQVTSITNFSYEEIRRSPGGLEDVVRALSVLPGVAQQDAGRNDLVVRGGAPSENLYLVDGFVTPNINHFGTQGATGGPLSFINLDFVKDVQFSTGGFSANYGDKLSSVLSLDLRDGRNDKIGGKLLVSATQFGLNLEGPLSDNSTAIVSVRRSYLDFIFKAAGFGFVPEYWDVLTKYNYKIDNHNSIGFLYVGAFDNVKYFNDTRDKLYKNSRILGSNQVQYLTGISFRHLFNKGYYDIRLSRNYSSYDTQQKDTLLNPIFKNVSKEQENLINLNLLYKITPKSEIQFGGDYKFIKFDSDILLPKFVTSYNDTLAVGNITNNEIFNKLSLYSQYSGYYFNRLRFNLGVRFDYFDAIKKYSISPRLSLSYYLTDITNISGSAGKYYQSPSYIWLVGNKKNRELDFIEVDQYILGIEQKLRRDVNLKVETFYKDYKKYPASLTRPYLVLANTGAGFGGGQNNFAEFGLEPLVSGGSGDSRGIELSLQKKSSDIPHYGIFSLTYSETYFSGLDGKRNIGNYDQRLILNLSAGYIFNEKYEASVKFRYSTGKPYTPYNSDGTQKIENYNSARTSDFHSLDFRIDRRWNFSKWNLIVYLDIQNIYNRKNQTTISWDSRENKIQEASAIGILPSIGISAEL